MLCPALPLLPPLQFDSKSKVAEDEGMLTVLDRLTRTSQEMHAINTDLVEQVTMIMMMMMMMMNDDYFERF
jgi:hypothetical protein